MAYTTLADLRTRYGAEIDQLMDRDNTGIPDETIGDEAIAGADALIDTHLAARYPVPVSPTPKLLTLLCGDIARYLLWDDSVPEIVRQRYEDAIETLQAISRGKADLVGASGEIDSSTRSDAGAIYTAGRTPIDMEGYLG